MKFHCVSSICLLAVIAVSAQPCEDLECDKDAIRAILDTNGCLAEENLDYIIGTSKNLKRKVAYGILKDSGIRPIELHNLTLENIDLEQGIIYIFGYRENCLVEKSVCL